MQFVINYLLKWNNWGKARPLLIWISVIGWLIRAPVVNHNCSKEPPARALIYKQNSSHCTIAFIGDEHVGLFLKESVVMMEGNMELILKRWTALWGPVPQNCVGGSTSWGSLDRLGSNEERGRGSTETTGNVTVLYHWMGIGTFLLLPIAVFRGYQGDRIRLSECLSEHVTK